eukprot:CAMPEP_0113958386 /NCGR_PEP_ID=MMETSP0011_2-20120614/3387_1 /TAXON_ID=101924 /ORGANISM="Rhodosorus marinus" /LENGTH=960 /DNA_ID=CAMNT_0000969235 /DNA_START=152 /DNA_END=3031 /DNA_ORIENTATION=- /assembly_acc=CAM_ASM_000156
MVMINVSGLDVNFPFTPYECQKVYMEHVVQALQMGSNALLESPTGTGKTLCLLCAVLAWRESFVSSLSKSDRGDRACQSLSSGLEHTSGQQGGSSLATIKSVAEAEDMIATRTGPRIIYTSRTHSQLTQVVRELKRTKYRTKMTVLGSRSQLCIHPEVSKAPTGAQNAMCSQYVANHKCMHKNELDSRKDELVQKVMKTPVDIEDLVRIAGIRGACPYYLARNARESSDLILMPYNYVVDSATRDRLDIDWNKDIVIFDEAHNLDSVCMEARSFDLTSHHREACLREIQRIESEADRIPFGPGTGEQSQVNTELLRTFLQALEGRVKDLEIKAGTYFSGMGDSILRIFDQSSVATGKEKSVLSEVEAARQYLLNDSSLGQYAPGLTALAEALATVSDLKPEILREEFRVCVCIEPEKNDPGTLRQHFQSYNQRGNRTLSLWCMNPAISMNSILRKGVRSILMTSGTLAPLDGTEKEMGIPFQVKLENSHVIGEGQALMTCVPRGPRGVFLNSSYKNRDSEDYLAELGSSIMNFAQVVPEGILVFFSSYNILGKSVALWQRRAIGEKESLYERLNRRKPIVLEPRDSSSFNAALELHQSNVRDKGGSILFAVCRGKTSEGLDFSDSLARCVIVVGIPYPTLNDPKVSLKRDYLERRRGKRAGSEWYVQNAFRAVNQAVGRAIRHRNDYGAILLCDQRFLDEKSRARFSSWLRPHFSAWNSFGVTQRSLVNFFRSADKAPFTLQRKRDLEERETAENKRMRSKCKVEGFFEAIQQQATVRESKDSRAHQGRIKHVQDLLPMIRGELGADKYDSFLSLLREAKRVSALRKTGKGLHHAEVRTCLRELHSLFGSSENGILILNNLLQFIPSNLKDDYRRFVTGFLLSKVSCGNTGVLGLLKATRMSLGEDEYAKFRRQLGELKEIGHDTENHRVREILQGFRETVRGNVPPGQSPSANELLTEW